MRVTNPAVPSWNPTSSSSTAAGETLRMGHQGPGVTELQQLLNAAGAQPPLQEDGVFGPKTQAALQKATGSSVLDGAARAVLSGKAQGPEGASGAEAASALPGLDEILPGLASVFTSGTDTATAGGPELNPHGELPQVASTVAVDQKQAPSGSVAERTLQRAYAEEDSINPMKRGEDGHYKGWQQLQNVFEKTTGWRPTDAECQKITPGGGAKPGGKSWCGIWACHVLQEAGVNVKWDLTKGKMVGDVTHVQAPRFTGPAQYKAERAAFEQSIRPGDVITLKGGLNHHAIVTQVHPDGTVETMDGNKPHVGRGRTKLADVTSYYRPNAS